MLKLLPYFSVGFSYGCNICTPPRQLRLGQPKMRAGVVLAQILRERCRGQTDFPGCNVESSRAESLKRIG
jgi:hypothetical protein